MTMPPRAAVDSPFDAEHGHHEKTPLAATNGTGGHLSFSENDEDNVGSNCRDTVEQNKSHLWAALKVVFAVLVVAALFRRTPKAAGKGAVDKIIASATHAHTGPYQLLQSHHGESFFDYYDFLDGPDSIGSAGHNIYVGRDRAEHLGIANVTTERGEDGSEMSFVYMSSAATAKGPRESVRLEGKTLFNRGLFLLDLDHMPAGCGVWPAWWMTREEHWPDDGEIDVVEGINTQTVAKTALHTSEQCDMYAHVADYNRTGVWDRASGLPDTFTGKMDFETSVPADNCWNMAPHEWQNQGCVTVSTENATMGAPLNEQGGGVFALEWDPDNLYIRSWVFPRAKSLPKNLQASLDSAAQGKKGDDLVRPDTQSWGLPYAYFAIGPDTGCSADHFKNMRIVFNLAFCGNVAGNRFSVDCPTEAEQFAPSSKSSSSSWGSPIEACNAFIESQPEILSEAYWKIKGLYVYERELRKL